MNRGSHSRQPCRCGRKIRPEEQEQCWPIQTRKPCRRPSHISADRVRCLFGILAAKVIERSPEIRMHRLELTGCAKFLVVLDFRCQDWWQPNVDLNMPELASGR